MTDLRIGLRGRSFSVIRNHWTHKGAGSAVDTGRTGELGNNWASTLGEHVYEVWASDGMGGSFVQELRVYAGGTGYASYSRALPTDDFVVPTPQGLRITENTTTRGGQTIGVWVFEEPGRWRRMFRQRSGTASDLLRGEILLEEDAWGNSLEYQYQRSEDDDGQDPEDWGDEYRLARIVARSVNSDGNDVVDALIRLQWTPLSQATQHVLGIDVFRPVPVIVDGDRTNWQWKLGEQVKYTYSDGASYSTDLGPAGELIQVDLIDPVSNSADVTYSNSLSEDIFDPEVAIGRGATDLRHRYTQYRYYGSGSGDGLEGQLKAVIAAEQIEYCLWKNTGVGSPIVATAEDLLGLDDDDAAISGSADVADLEAKLVTYNTSTGRVATQYIQAGCGCGGATSGLRMTYSFYQFGTPTANSALNGALVKGAFKIVSEVSNGSGGWDPNITNWYDLVVDSAGDPLTKARIASAVTLDDTAAADGPWVYRYDYDAGGRVVSIAEPSTVTAYARDGSNFPAITEVSSGGLRHRYEYYSTAGLDDGKIKTYYLTDKGTGSEEVIRQWEYLTTGDTPGLVSTLKAYRTGVPRASLGSLGDDDVEVTEYAYTFHPLQTKLDNSHTADGGISSTTVTLERETPAENGPAGSGNTVSKSALLDQAGRLVWQRHYDGVLVRTDYDEAPDVYEAGVIAPAGGGLRTVMHADPGLTDFALPSSWPGGLSLTGWDGSPFSGPSFDAQTLTFRYDLIGRRIATTKPTGAQDSVWFELAAPPSADDTSGFERFTAVHVPATVALDGDDDASELAGPLARMCMAANGRVVSARSFAPSWVHRDADGVMSEQTKGGSTAAYVVSTELGRDYAPMNIAGQVDAYRLYHDVGNGWYDTTTFEYDRLGRQTKVVDGGGTIQATEYDVLNRAVSLSIGTDDGAGTSNMSTYLETEYGAGPDGDLAATLRVHVSDSETRESALTYDRRGRLTIVENPSAPHTFVGYDNLNRIVAEGRFTSVPSVITSSGRAMYATFDYSQRGMLYRLGVATDPTNTSTPTLLYSHSWYDDAGRKLATWMPGSPASKIEYDEAGRPVVMYVTDRNGATTTGSGSYATMSAVQSNEYVLQQTEYRFIAGQGLIDLITSRSLVHDPDTSTHRGELKNVGDNDGAITTYTGYFYDAAARPIAIVDYGKNGSGSLDASTWNSPPTITQASPPAATPTASQMVTRVAYNARGVPQDVTDPNGIVTRRWYDDAARVVAVTENYEDVTIERTSASTYWTVDSFGSFATYADEDRTTLYTYDPAGNLKYQAAASYDGSAVQHQVTEYRYGVSKGSSSNIDDSLIATNNLPNAIWYPDPSTGAASSSNAISLAFDRAAEVRFYEDQRGVQHTFEYNDRGQATADIVASLGASGIVDSAVRRLDYTYDSLGQLTNAISRASTSPTGTIVNEAELAYDADLHFATSVTQNPVGAVGVSASTEKQVAYAYSTTGLGVPLPDSITYPDGVTQVSFTYAQPSGGIDNEAISRPTGLSWNGYRATGGTDDHTAEYAYLGLGTTVIKSMAMPYLTSNGGLHFDLFTPGDTSTTATGTYPGIDHFGRLVRERWIPNGYTPSTKPEVYDKEIVYNDSANSLLPALQIDRRGYVEGLTGAGIATGNEKHSYDELYRLTENERGAYNTSTQAFTQSFFSQDYQFDALGNWAQYRIDLDGNGSYSGSDETETRGHDGVNALTDRFNAGTPPDLSLGFDAAGNMVSQEKYAGGTTGTWTYTYDAWNRLVNAAVTPSGGSLQQRAAYSYDALHSMVTRTADMDAVPDGVAETRQRLYYGAAWQLLEQRQDTDSGGWVEESVTQWVWGLDYVDELLFFQVDGDDDGSYDDAQDKGYYAVQDARYALVALTDTRGDVVERIRYDAYGRPRAYVPGDVNDDGTVNSIDLNAVLAVFGDVMGTDSTYRADCDFNADGSITSADSNVILANTGKTGAWDTLSALGALHGLGGYTYDPQVQLYHVRNRAFDPALGRWMQRDPAGYVDGMSLYEYAMGGPWSGLDPSGLWKWDDGWIQYGVGGLFGFYGSGPVVEGLVGGAQGLAAEIDGAIPFYDPLASAGAYDKDDPILQFSQDMGALARDLLLIAAIPNLGQWLKNPWLYEVGSQTLPSWEFAELLGGPAARGAQLLAKGGLRFLPRFIGPWHVTLFMGPTPGAWIALISIFHWLDYQDRHYGCSR